MSWPLSVNFIRIFRIAVLLESHLGSSKLQACSNLKYCFLFANRSRRLAHANSMPPLTRASQRSSYLRELRQHTSAYVTQGSKSLCAQDMRYSTGICHSVNTPQLKAEFTVIVMNIENGGIYEPTGFYLWDVWTHKNGGPWPPRPHLHTNKNIDSWSITKDCKRPWYIVTVLAAALIKRYVLPKDLEI